MATFSPPDSNTKAFLRAATASPTGRPFSDLAATGFIACAALSLMLSTPGAAQAAPKPATPKVRRVAQTSLTKTSGVTSLLSRAPVSPLHTLHPVAASSRRSTGTEEQPESETETKAVARRQTVTRAAAKQESAKTDSPIYPSPVELLAAAPDESAPQSAPVPETASSTAPAQIAETPVTAQEVVVKEVIAEGPAQTPAEEPAGELREPLTGTVDFSSTVQPEASTPDAAPVGEQAVPANAQNSRLYAPSISYDGGTIIAEGTPENPVRLESEGARIIAQKVRLDTVGKTVSAEGKVRVERQIVVERYSAFRTRGRGDETNRETVTETLEGENFDYNYETRQGRLGATNVRLANFNVSAESLIVNGQKYIARNVVVRPGGLSDEELKIYGTPPFNLRLREFTVDMSKPAATGAAVSDTAQSNTASVQMGGRARGKGGALYFKNTRLLPVPSALFNRRIGDNREEPVYQITPRIYYNSSDGLLLTTKLFFPFSQQNPERLTLSADVGLSTRVGFRGGIELESETRLGDFSLGARVSDVISTQLTNRIELDRLPEIRYSPPALGLFDLPGGRRAGLKFGFVAGDYRERFSDGRRQTESSRYQGQVRFTTRMSREDGPYLDLFARAARYSDHFENLRTAGYEVGYIGPLTSRLAGHFSYSATNVSGSTPFRFDEVEIRKELRATFDIMLTPRYIIPIDLRYDIERGELRDRSIGLLRNYKTFAYGVTYRSARKELKLEIRQGF